MTERPEPPATPSRPQPEPQSVAGSEQRRGGRPERRLDARSLRGLAHPLRMEIVELLNLDGASTATRLAERLGENTGTVSWHLRHLAEHGFIEEETGRGTKRERWWRRVPVSNRLDTVDFRDDPDSRGALSLYLHEMVQQSFNRVTSYLGEEWENEWRNSGTLSNWSNLHMTPSQLKSLNRELTDLVNRYAPDPDAEPDPEALPVIVQIQAFPRRPRGAE